jgi:uncharacterized protein YndB with AHSA1/START domain
MTVTRVDKDPAAATMTITAEFDAGTHEVWQLWADPRLLERWWGPPGYPATFVVHELSAGGAVSYFMTGPEGDRNHGVWRLVEVAPPTRLVFEDAFADSEGNANPEMPTTTTQVTLADRDGGGTTMTVRTTYPSAEAMEQVLAMGMEEGIRAAMGQMDALLVGR